MKLPKLFPQFWLKSVNSLLLGSILLTGCVNLSPTENQSDTFPVKNSSISPNTSLKQARLTVQSKLESVIPISFLDWCKNRESFSPEIRHTIRVLLETAKTTDCSQAEVRLQASDTLYLNSFEIEAVAPIASLTNLRALDLSSNNIENVAPLTALNQLIGLDLSYNPKIKDFTPLASLSKLRGLELVGNRIEDTSRLIPLAQSPNLIALDLAFNQLKDITPLSNLTNIKVFNLSFNQLEDITPLSVLTQVYRLDLSFNQIKDFMPLQSLQKLSYLNLSSNKIQDISALVALTNLHTLYLSDNQIEDISSLTALAKKLSSLALSNNQIVDVTPLNSLKNLESIELSSNQIEEISPLAPLNRLVWLSLANNQIKEIGPLTVLRNLEWLNLSSNQIDDVAILEILTNLKLLNLTNNPLLASFSCPVVERCLVESPKSIIYQPQKKEQQSGILPVVLPPPEWTPHSPRYEIRFNERDIQSFFTYYYYGSRIVYTRSPDNSGIGHLRPVWETRDLNLYNPYVYGGWLQDVILPFYEQPNGAVRGWIARGWLLETTSSTSTPIVLQDRPFAMRQGGYKGSNPSFYFYEIREDGWFKWRYGHATLKNDGLAWSHITHLNLGAFPLQLERWEEFLMRKNRGHHLYRWAVRRQPVYNAPTANSQILTQILDNDTSTMEILEFKGDWMKIDLRVFSAPFCTSGELVSEYQGWVRWRTPELGSSVWPHEGGC